MDSYCYARCPKQQDDDDLFEALLGPPRSHLLKIKAGGVTKYAGEGEDSIGGGKAMTIKGEPFAGRMQGGGERSQIFGTSEYGSGYPNQVGRGVSRRGFPFYFWPVMWTGVPLGIDDAYLYTSTEYGPPSNASRPGGFLSTIAFGSNTTGNIYRIFADNATTAYLIPQIVTSCMAFLNFTSILPVMYPSSMPFPLPEQAIQYYRASSIALTLDGYNNTAALSNDSTPLPLSVYNNSDPTLGCLNTTIGRVALVVAQKNPLNDDARTFVQMLLVVLIMIGISVCLCFSCCACSAIRNRRVQRGAQAVAVPAPVPPLAPPPPPPPPDTSVTDTKEEDPTVMLPRLPWGGPVTYGRSNQNRDADTESQWSSSTMTHVGGLGSDDIALQEMRPGRR